MSNIKGLYFKMNMDNPVDAKLYNYFKNEAKRRGMSKICLLASMMCIYKLHIDDDLQKAEEDFDD